jgi:peptide deformylase
MAVRPIVIYPNKILRQKCKPVVLEDLEDPEIGGTLQICLEKMFGDMEDTLEETDKGAALAANQIGIDSRVFVTNQMMTQRHGMATGTQAEDLVILAIPPVVINPEILKKSPEQDMLDEGCLSFPGFGMKVRRHRAVKVKYSTLLKVEGRWEVKHVEETYKGFWAQVFQHEIDHLDGKLFVDSLPERKRLEIVKIVGRKR